jgi:aryl-alcohol dehydrogenase-like predicted oxidoreductase
MEYRRLGRSGLFVSALTLGTMTFGGDTWRAGTSLQYATPTTSTT